MNTLQIRVTFQPQGRAVSVLAGTKIVEAAARAGVVIETPCGGAGTCGKCRVRVTMNPNAPTPADKKAFSARELREGWRLACQYRLDRETVVFVPATSLFGGEHQILAATDASTPRETLPAIRKAYAELAPPTLDDDAPDLLRLERSVGPMRADLAMIRHVSATLRANCFKGTAVLADRRLIDFEPGDTRDRCYGVAFDIGTTTMVGELLSLCDGRELGVVSRMNPQVSYGDDVLSRIRHARACPGCLDEMRLAVVREVAGMVDTLCAGAGVKRDHVYEASFAGNTTMEHILCGMDPAQLGEIPFVPLHARGLLVPSQELGIPIHHWGMAYVFPLIGGFVGGDTVAGMLATGIDRL
ncbi:MAG: 2Fe-2S iron-sulfur cluster-binding protein, partial [Kiritimatiellae bacterium]|nr:2Fe-2S iron-sulfur cluster-binding protein [Kiritimatiellia bacterium]